MSPIDSVLPSGFDGVAAVQPAAIEMLPHAMQVAVFDTAFHESMPPRAFLYALPYELYEQHHVRRYGFHGTSHRYVAEVAAGMLGKAPQECNLITVHLGNGRDLYQNGVVSFINRPAQDCGVETGMKVSAAAQLLLDQDPGDPDAAATAMTVRTRNRMASGTCSMV